MNLQKYKWPIVVIVIISTLALLALSQFLWNHFALETPLYQTIQEINGVEMVTWDNRDKNASLPKIHVTLNNVANLEKTYQEITDHITTILGSKKYKMIIHDHRTPELEQFYYSLQPQIQEAIATGKFSIMTEIIQEKSLASHTQAQVYIDGNYIYLQLVNGNSNFYTIIPRHSVNVEVK